jgi:hypothetical protein
MSFEVDNLNLGAGTPVVHVPALQYISGRRTWYAITLQYKTLGKFVGTTGIKPKGKEIIRKIPDAVLQAPAMTRAAYTLDYAPASKPPALWTSSIRQLVLWIMLRLPPKHQVPFLFLKKPCRRGIRPSACGRSTGCKYDIPGHRDPAG